jgi:4-amino-4-deoxy-L-arabinose transferase-like glycosyltransferase
MRWPARRLCHGVSRQTRYIPNVRELVRQHLRFYLITLLAAVALRLLFILRFPGVTTDSFIYGDIAKNWLLHGIYGISGPNGPDPTWIRLPGYPAFLAGVFALFGMEHYNAVLFIQLFVDIGTCVLIADLARRLMGTRAANISFLLAALCPFLANYTAAALTETLEVFCTVAAVDLMVVGLDRQEQRNGLRVWAACGLAVGAAILLRPDGGLLLAAIGLYLAWCILRRIRVGKSYGRLVLAGISVLLVALAPLVPWTVRNFHTFDRFEPMAPRYANEENEFVPIGFNRWVKTWIADYASVEEIYWPVPGDSIDASKLPDRAFDSEEQREETEQLISDYNDSQHVTPDLDARFQALAEARIRESRLRYYVWLPMMCVADMWLRPRTEMLPSDSRWWEFNDDTRWSILAVVLGVINLAYIGLACAGLLRHRAIRYLGLLVTFAILRSAFLGTLENPEPRYTLECYFVVILLATAWFNRAAANVD